MKKVDAALVLVVVAVAALMGFGVWHYANFPADVPGNTESITIGYAPFESITLFCVAEDQRFFSKNGLNLTTHKYDTGVGALDGMLNGEVDIVVGTNEFPLVGRAFQKEKIRTIGCIAKSEFIYLVGRKDRGIETPSDLKGKKIGTTLRTIADFYLGRFLELHGMSMQDVTFVDVKTPAEWVNAVADGDIDAIVTAQPYANSARDRLGSSNAVFWSAQSSQPLYTQVISTEEWIAKNPELTRRFLRSLAEAEEYVNAHPAEAGVIVQERLNLDLDYMDTVWKQNQFSLSLDQSLITAMEDEARWMISNNLTAEEMPNFLDYVDEDDLKVIKPESVNIIR